MSTTTGKARFLTKGPQGTLLSHLQKLQPHQLIFDHSPKGGSQTSPRVALMRSKSKQMGGLAIASPNYDEERRSVSSAVKFIRARGIAEEEAKKQIEKLNQLMSKRMKRETSAT